MNVSVQRPDLRQLRIQAKELVRAVHLGEQAALARVVPYFGSAPEFTLVNAQLVIARENGCESWSQLKAELGAATPDAERPMITRLFEAFEKGEDALAAGVVPLGV
jgi:hypothetical protein